MFVAFSLRLGLPPSLMASSSFDEYSGLRAREHSRELALKTSRLQIPGVLAQDPSVTYTYTCFLDPGSLEVVGTDLNGLEFSLKSPGTLHIEGNVSYSYKWRESCITSDDHGGGFNYTIHKGAG